MTALIFDTESTGITEPRLIEAAWLEVTPALEIKNRFHQRYNPGKPIELGALATHHIMDEDLQGCPAYSDFTLPPTTEYLIGHNVDYDWKLIGEPKVKRICTLVLARYIWPDLDCHKQSALLYYINRAKAREQLKEAHTAEADVMNCMRFSTGLHDFLDFTDVPEVDVNQFEYTIFTPLGVEQFVIMQGKVVSCDYAKS